MFGLSVVELIEIILIGLFCCVHVVSNFVSARCNCKLCSSIRKLLGLVQTGEVDDSETVSESSSISDPELVQLLGNLLDRLEKLERGDK